MKSLCDRLHQALLYGLMLTFIILIFIGIISKIKNRDIFYSVVLTVVSIMIIILTLYDILNRTRIYERFDTLEEFRIFINSYGGISKIVLIIAQMLQVTLVPIPSSLSIIVGDELFGFGWSYILCLIGVMLGSIMAFGFGRILGIKFANYLLGKKNLVRYQKIVKGKDKILLSLMFIFPFFPDDLLCIIAGLSTMSFGGFVFIMLVSRSISIFGTLLIKRGLLIIVPFKGWGISIWAIFLILIICSMVYGIKNSERIENYVSEIANKIKNSALYVSTIKRLEYFTHKKSRIIYEEIYK